MSSPGYANALPPSAVIRRLAAATATAQHEFWPDELSLLDERMAEPDRILGPRQVTDVYLLGMAVRHGGRLATFDSAIPIRAIRGAASKHLLAL
jgi:predicted nucleic acid-binding protein